MTILGNNSIRLTFGEAKTGKSKTYADTFMQVVNIKSGLFTDNCSKNYPSLPPILLTITRV